MTDRKRSLEDYPQEPARRAQTDRIDRTVDGLLRSQQELLNSQVKLLISVCWIYVIIILVVAPLLVVTMLKLWFLP